jgi:hypothetical protein
MDFDIIIVLFKLKKKVHNPGQALRIVEHAVFPSAPVSLYLLPTIMRKMLFFM